MKTRIRIKHALLALVGAGMVAGSLGACAQAGRGPDGGADAGQDRSHWQGRMLDRAAAKLDLTEAQKQKLSTLADKMRAQRRALMGGEDSTMNPRTEFAAVIVGSRFDQARAQALLDEKLGILRSGGSEVIAAMADFFDSLDAAQQQRVRAYLEQRRGGWRRHR